MAPPARNPCAQFCPTRKVANREPATTVRRIYLKNARYRLLGQPAPGKFFQPPGRKCRIREPPTTGLVPQVSWLAALVPDWHDAQMLEPVARPGQGRGHLQGAAASAEARIPGWSV